MVVFLASTNYAAKFPKFLLLTLNIAGQNKPASWSGAAGLNRAAELIPHVKPYRLHWPRRKGQREAVFLSFVCCSNSRLVQQRELGLSAGNMWA